MIRLVFVVVMSSLLVFSLVGCSQKEDSETQEPQSQAQSGALTQEQYESLNTVYNGKSISYTHSGIKQDFNTEPVEVGGISFKPASQWRELPASGQKVAHYCYGPLGTDTDSAVVAVFYFGKDQGGGVEDNIDRWIYQIEIPDGRDPKSTARLSEHVADGMTLHMVSMDGTYRSPVGGPMSNEFEPKEKYRLVGVIVEGPEGNVFFKLTGPDYTGRIMIEGFVPMVKAIRKAG